MRKVCKRFDILPARTISATAPARHPQASDRAAGRRSTNKSDLFTTNSAQTGNTPAKTAISCFVRTKAKAPKPAATAQAKWADWREHSHTDATVTKAQSAATPDRKSVV